MTGPTADPTGRLTMVALDRDGNRCDEQGVVARLLDTIGDTRRPVTDIFVLSHGWQTDSPTATAMYSEWIRTMRDHLAGPQAALRERRPDFRPVVVGIRWPSVPWERPAGAMSFEQEVAFYTDLIGDPAAEEELRPLLAEANAKPDAELSEADEQRLRTLDARSGLALGHVGAAPGDDRASFEPRRIVADFRETRDDGAEAGRSRSILAPLWVTSFWTMKRRAWQVGRSGGHRLLQELRAAAPSQARFHLVGHSFGAIVCAGAIQGDGSTPAASVHSLILLQGALSLWAFAPRIPDTERSGFFHPLITQDLVTGPLVTTRSRHDRALKWYFRMAATVARDNRLAGRLPRYGAVGTYGLAGVDRVTSEVVGPGRLHYGIRSANRYDLVGDAVISGRRFSVQGAHSDLAHPEIAAAIWEAATST
ncbi:hypothetical protein ACIRL2_44995 [Embleya sp. NPDC127516]|uniref:hypothetical protein n=1 Tax=Embleya sp. NPDC127516 TaxID=3363990 RepID=UPI0037F31E37